MTRVGRVAAIAAAVFGIAAIALDASGGDTTVRFADLDGATLFRSKGCASCHAGPDTDGNAMGLQFPRLTDAPDWAGERRPGMTAEAYIAESIREPAAFFSPEFHGGAGPVTAMPQLGLSDAEIDAVVAYLLDR